MERKGKETKGKKRYGCMVCEQKDSTMYLTSFSDGVPALLPCTDFCLALELKHHVYMQGPCALWANIQ